MPTKSQRLYTVEQAFNHLNHRINPLPKGEYEACTFVNCDFSEASLSEYMFTECTFKGCNLSLAKLVQTAFREVQFNECKLVGLLFDTCNTFGFSVSFERCNLGQSSFYKTGLKKTIFKHSQLPEVDFTESDLTAALFDSCDLSGAIFEHTNLEKADFRTSFNYAMNPEINGLKKARFSRSGIAGLLHKYDIDIEE